MNSHHAIVNYLVYFEGLAPLILNNVVNIEKIDDLMAYRFFVVTNNPDVQERHLKVWPDYYRGCFRLFKKWKDYRKAHDLPVVLDEYSLDKWKYFEYYANDKIEIRKINKKDNWKVVAKLIYETDEYIYPAAFKNKFNAKRFIPQLMGEPNNFFFHENIRVACIDKKIVGIIVFFDKPFSAKIDEKLLNKLPASFHDVNEKYFSQLFKDNNVKDNNADSPICIACLCVLKKNRQKGIGRLLFIHVISKYKERNITLDVLDINKPAIDLYKKFGFQIKLYKIDRFSYTRNLVPTVYSMEKPPVLSNLKNSKEGFSLRSLESSPRKDGFRMPGEFEPHEGS